jgi:hypothetical protein
MVYLSGNSKRRIHSGEFRRNGKLVKSHCKDAKKPLMPLRLGAFAVQFRNR